MKACGAGGLSSDQGVPMAPAQPRLAGRSTARGSSSCPSGLACRCHRLSWRHPRGSAPAASRERAVLDFSFTHHHGLTLSSCQTGLRRWGEVSISEKAINRDAFGKLLSWRLAAFVCERIGWRSGKRVCGEVIIVLAHACQQMGLKSWE